MLLVALLVLTSCEASDPLTSGGARGGTDHDTGLFCRVSTDDIFAPLGPEAIRALTDPPLVAAGHEDASYVDDADRIVGVRIGDEAIAVPHNVLYWHEAVNLDRGDASVAISFCPLTGTSLAFDRSVIDGRELGVSGLLFRNNLVLYDRGVPTEDRSFFPQMLRSAACGPLGRRGLRLPMVPSSEMRWGAWKTLYPETLVLSERTGFPHNYRVNPNEWYERPDNPVTRFPVQIDSRRLPKERVFGIPVAGDGGPALPFGALERWARAAVPVVGGNVVLWDRDAQAAIAFTPLIDDQRLSLRPAPEGFTDRETGSSWRLDGLATDGPLAGRRLEQVAEAYVAFWFAWAAFQPETWLWSGG